MPKVGNKHFPYTEEGMAAARAYAKKQDKRLITVKARATKNGEIRTQATRTHSSVLAHTD